jgi:predicted ATPase/DNA-binding CsgD family transcriptional regulator
MAEVTQWLAAHRLVTLTGAGGCGKTRLALETGRGLLPHFAEGVWLVDFSPLVDPALVVQAAARVLRVQEQPARPLLETLSDTLRHRQLLLIFDNCEHLAAACAQLATALLQFCPDLHILATSREPLRVTGEVVWNVPPLSLPAYQPWHDPAGSLASLAAYQHSEAVQLFVARAKIVSPAFSLSIENGAWIAEICRHLDGMPLAIELAAARVRVLSVREIAERLDQRFSLLTDGSRTALPRQQTLAATLDWSYRLLTEAERVVLQRLAVFAGGCTLAAAEAVCCDETIPAGDVLAAMSHLVDKSLVIADPKEEGTRYRLLETIRQYAREKLLECGELAAIQQRHCVFLMEWAERAEPYAVGPDQVVWHDQYEVEHDNLRAALDWCYQDQNRAIMGLRLATACTAFWHARAYVGEGTTRLLTALSQSSEQASEAVRAKALTQLGILLFMHSDFPAMRRYLEESLSIWRKLGQDGRAGLADTLNHLGDLASEQGDYKLARLLLQESLDVYRELNHVGGICGTLLLFGWIGIRTGDYTQAESYLRESLAIAQQGGERMTTTFALSGLGEAALRQGNYEEATAVLEESLRLNRAGGYRWGMGTVLGSLGWVASLQRDYARMRATLGESLAIRLEIGDQGGIAWCLEKLAEAALLEGERASASSQLECYQSAVRLFAAAAAIREPIHSAMDQVDQSAYQRNLATLRAGLGEAAFAAAWAEGDTLELEAIIARALAEAPVDVDSPSPHHPSPTQPYAGLTARECEAAILIAQGKSNREIAQAMTVRVKTVETYVTRILGKLAFESRVQIATWALEQGLTSSDHRTK